MKWSAFAVASVISAVILGCSTEVDVYQPVPVPDFENKIDVDVVWSSSIGSGVGKYYSNLHPVFDSEHVYAASRNGDVYSFDKKDGDRVWHFDVSDEDENDERRSTRLSGGLTFADTYNGKFIFVGSENGWVYAIDADEGTLKWKHFVGEEILSSPAYDDDKVFVLTDQGQLFGLNAENGEELWATGDDTHNLSLRGDSNPIAVHGQVVIYGTSDGKLNIVSQERGVLINQIRVGTPHGKTQLSRLGDVNASPIIIGDELYATSYNGNLKGVRFPNMNAAWERQYSSIQNLAYDLSDIAITDPSGHIYGIIRLDGSERWGNTGLTYRNVTGPAYVGDYVVVGDYEGYVYWIDGATGEFKNKTQLNSSGIYTAPVADDEVAYVVSRNGTLYAVKVHSDVEQEDEEDDNENEEASSQEDSTEDTSDGSTEESSEQESTGPSKRIGL